MFQRRRVLLAMSKWRWCFRSFRKTVDSTLASVLKDTIIFLTKECVAAVCSPLVHVLAC